MLTQHANNQFTVSHSRAKTLLIMLSLVLFVANIYFLSATRDLARSYSDRQNQATWFLFQLSKEFSELIASAPYAHESQKNLNHTLLKYELTWSRFDLLIDNKEFDSMMDLEGAYEFFMHIFSKFKQLEPSKAALSNANGDQKFTQEMQRLYSTMIQFINVNFRVKSPIYRTQMAKAKVLSQIQFSLMLLLLSCAGLVVYILHKESLYHRQLAMIDTLTGVKNRLAMVHHVEDKIERYQPFAIYSLDLNGFKGVNDTYGHQAGDAVLETLAQRLNAQQTDHQFSIYRIGGDEFSILSERVDENSVLFLHQHIHNTFIEPIELGDGNTVSVSTSIGYAQFPQHGNDLNQLISVADKKMYQMKFAKR